MISPDLLLTSRHQANQASLIGRDERESVRGWKMIQSMIRTQSIYTALARVRNCAHTLPLFAESNEDHTMANIVYLKLLL